MSIFKTYIFEIYWKIKQNFQTKKVPKIIKSLKNPNTKVQQGFHLEYYSFQLE